MEYRLDDADCTEVNGAGGLDSADIRRAGEMMAGALSSEL